METRGKSIYNLEYMFLENEFMTEQKIDKMRLFIGSSVEFPIINEENTGKLSEYFPCPIRFLDKSNIHLTWKFIGGIETDKLLEIQYIVEETLTKISDININFTDFKIWPSGNRPSLLVLAGQDMNGKATKLHQKLDKKLEKLKITRETRNFLPHITVARFKIKERPVEKFVVPDWLLFDEVRVKFSELSIFESVSTENGSVYTPIKSFDII